MITIKRASINDYQPIVQIGKMAVREAHQASCSEEDLNEYMDKHYNDEAIQTELNNAQNIYHILYYDQVPVVYSKIVLNAEHEQFQKKNVTKLDRIYLLKEYFNLKLGYELLLFNMEYAKQNQQSGIWLFTWVGNTRAVNFYLKVGFKVIGTHWFKVSENHSNENHHMFLSFSDHESPIN